MVLNTGYYGGFSESSSISVGGVYRTSQYDNTANMMEACYRLSEETNLNFDLYNKRIAYIESKYLRENGREMIYEEFDIQGIVSRVIEFIKSWLEKVLSVIRRAIAEMSARIAGFKNAFGIKKDKLKKVKGIFKDTDEYKDKNYLGVDIGKASLYTDFSNFKELNHQGIADNDEDLDADGFVANEFSKIKFPDSTGGMSSYKFETRKDISTSNLMDKICGADIDITKSVVSKYDGKFLTNTLFENKTIKNLNDLAKKAKNSADSALKVFKDKANKQVKNDSLDRNDAAKSVHYLSVVINYLLAGNNNLVTVYLSILVKQLGMANRLAKIYLKNNNKTDEDEKEGTKDSAPTAESFRFI